MTAYEYLSQAYMLDQLIQSKLLQIEKLKALANSTSGFVRPDRPVVKRTRRTDVMEQTVMKIMEAEKELDEEIDTMVDKKLEIGRTISMVQDLAWQLVLEKRYLNFETWEGIAAEMYISSRTVLRMHEKALEAVQEILDREVPGHDPELPS